MHRELIKRIAQLTAVSLVGTLLVWSQFRSAEPKTFRGTLHYPMMNIGGEGSTAKLETAGGVYDLFFKTRQPPVIVDRLTGRRVMVVGHARNAHGIERRKYRAIDVIELTIDDGHDEPTE